MTASIPKHEHSSAPQAVYLHIPFCTNKCFYCDFNSYVLKDQPVMEYLYALEREMENTVKLHPQEKSKRFLSGAERQPRSIRRKWNIS